VLFRTTAWALAAKTNKIWGNDHRVQPPDTNAKRQAKRRGAREVFLAPLFFLQSTAVNCVNVWLQSRSLPARGRVGLEVHRCLCIIDAGNVFISTVISTNWPPTTSISLV
jgi:hypothetical protein